MYEIATSEWTRVRYLSHSASHRAEQGWRAEKKRKKSIIPVACSQQFKPATPKLDRLLLWFIKLI